MTYLSEKLYKLYKLRGLEEINLNNSNINLDWVISEALDLIKSDVFLLNEDWMDSIKNAFHIEQIKTPQQFKAIINRLMPKDKSDLKRIESIVKKYENKIPSNKELKKKSIMVARKIDPKNGEKTYLSILLNIQKMIFKYEPFPSITILPLSLLLAFYVYLKVKKRNIPVSKVYAEMEKNLVNLFLNQDRLIVIKFLICCLKAWFYLPLFLLVRFMARVESGQQLVV